MVECIKYAEMSKEDHIFLATLLERYKPAKILEVGVARGGTSAFILKNIGAGQHLYGVDISDVWWSDKSTKVGIAVDELCNGEEKTRYSLLTGKDIVERIGEVAQGSDIDFCLLDTAHVLPGELLHFLAVYPYMKKGAVLALHDLSLNLVYPRERRDCSATRLLFCAAGSNCKMIPDMQLPNIGAFVVDDITERCISNVFMALTISWIYWPGQVLEKYQEFIFKHYDPFNLKVFKECMHRQKAFFPD